MEPLSRQCPSDESTLRARAREAIRMGRLPDRSPERSWGGRGSGAPCILCGVAVGSNETEIEFEFAPDGEQSGSVTCRLHAGCLRAWMIEIRAPDHGGGRDLPALSADGNMSRLESRPAEERP